MVRWGDSVAARHIVASGNGGAVRHSGRAAAALASFVMSKQSPTGPGFRPSTNMQIVQQKDGRWTIVVIQANIIPISAADIANRELVAQMVYGTVNGYDVTMDDDELVETLRYAAD
jgi:hypothetical protein